MCDLHEQGGQQRDDAHGFEQRPDIAKRGSAITRDHLAQQKRVQHSQMGCKAGRRSVHRISIKVSRSPLTQP